MSIANVVEFEQHNLQKVFGKNEGYWEYRTFDNEFLCYTVRTRDMITGGKMVKPWTFQNGKWVNKFFENMKYRPIFNAHLLKIHPDKPVLIVEGEKTAMAGDVFFPQFNTISWLGGCKQVKNVNFSSLKDKTIYLLPDNDAAGYEAMEVILKKIQGIAEKVYFVDIKRLGVSEKWDIADLLNTEYGEINIDDVIDFVLSTKIYIYPAIPLMDKSLFPLLTKKGNPINAYENLECILNYYKIDISFNVIRKEIIFNMPHKSFTLANKSKLDLAEINSLCIKNAMPRTDIVPWLTMIADKNSFNPVEQFVMSKPWDGISRIDDFLNTIQCTDNAIRDIYIYRWMLGALAVGICKKGMAHPGVLTFISKQGEGKSAWIQKLIPEELNLILGEFVLNPDDKDSVIRATKYWIVEFAEADATVNRSESSAQKAFLTRKVDQYRSPYDRADTEAPRHTCFIGTVNDAQFLKDETGNRRWWVLDVLSINHEHTLDMQQVWAEFKVLLDKGEQFYLTKDELKNLMEQNEAYRPSSPIEEAIRLKYNWGYSERNRKLTALQVLEDCSIDVKFNKNTSSKEANRVLRLLCAKEPKKIDGMFYYFLPPRK